MKQRIILSVIALALLTPSAWAQTQKVTRQSQQTEKPKPAAKKAVSRWKYQGEFYDGLACVQDANGKWGFIDKAGKLVIPCQWKLTRSFSGGGRPSRMPMTNGAL